MLSPGDVINNRYKISKVIGEGAFGTVYLARDSSLHMDWLAVKEMEEADIPEDERQEAVELFDREAEILKSLNHPGLPRFFERFSVGDCHYMVMEHIDGETLEEKLRNNHLPFTSDEVLPWAEELCLILVYLHTRTPEPVIFRDLKPSNIMIDANGRLKLIDFGIARRYSSRKTKDTYFMGTPGFSPPEQYGRGQSDCRSDIFALGATLYHLLTKADMGQYSTKLPPLSKLAPSVPKWLENVIMKCLAVNPGERYQSVPSLQADLQLRLFTAANTDIMTYAHRMIKQIPIAMASKVNTSLSSKHPVIRMRSAINAMAVTFIIIVSFAYCLLFSLSDAYDFILENSGLCIIAVVLLCWNQKMGVFDAILLPYSIGSPSSHNIIRNASRMIYADLFILIFICAICVLIDQYYLWKEYMNLIAVILIIITVAYGIYMIYKLVNWKLALITGLYLIFLSVILAPVYLNLKKHEQTACKSSLKNINGTYEMYATEKQHYIDIKALPRHPDTYKL